MASDRITMPASSPEPEATVALAGSRPQRLPPALAAARPGRGDVPACRDSWIIDGAVAVSKIAAWDTIAFGGGRRWTVIVSDACLARPTAANGLF